MREQIGAGDGIACLKAQATPVKARGDVDSTTLAGLQTPVRGQCLAVVGPFSSQRGEGGLQGDA